MTLLSSLPWKTHAVLSIALPLILVLPAYVQHGLGPDDYFKSTPLVSSYGFCVCVWLVTAPLIWIESDAAVGQQPNVARVSAWLAHSILAFAGTLQVTLHFVLTTSTSDPIEIALARSTAATYGLLLAVYLMATFVVAWARSGTHRRV